MGRRQRLATFGWAAWLVASAVLLSGTAIGVRASPPPDKKPPDAQRESQTARDAAAASKYDGATAPNPPVRDSSGSASSKGRSEASPQSLSPVHDKPPAAVADRGYVADATVGSIIPIQLRPNERVAVNVEILLAKPIPRSELTAQLRLLMDNTPLEPFPVPAGIANTPVASDATPADARDIVGSANPVQTAQLPAAQSNAVVVTLFARIPADVAAGRKVTLSVYSELDQRIIASAPIETIPAAPADESSRTMMLTILVGFILVTVMGFIGYRLERRKAANQIKTVEQEAAVQIKTLEQKAAVQIKTLEQTVLNTRNVLGAVTGEAPRQSASSAPGKPSQPVKKVEVPAALLEALERSEFGIIVGAGASVHANLPVGASLWLGALEKLRDAISPDQRSQLQKFIAESGSDAAIEPILSLVGRDRVVQALSSELAMEHASPKEFHRNLATLAQLGARQFVDLSWDLVLDEMLRNSQARTFSAPDFSGLSEALRTSQINVIKPYGQIGDPKGMSLTGQEFRRVLAQQPELERCLASLFSTRTLLFVGMSTRAIEQFTASLPPQLESSGHEHFALVPFDWSLELWSQGFAKRFGITVLPVGADDSDQGVTQVLERIVGEAQRRRAAQAPAPDKQSTFTGIGTLRSVQLRNIGNFKSIDIDFEEHWNLLLGDNGGGKSTILRAITLALSGNDPRGEAMASRLLRTGETTGSIELALGSTGATRLRTLLVRDGTRVHVKSPQITPLQAGQGLVLGFPALRGVTSTQPTGPTQMHEPNPSVDDVAPLLQERVDTRLNQLKQWVINTALRAESDPNGRHEQMFKTFRRVLRDVVPGRHVDFKDVDRNTWTVWLRTDDGEATFDSLSQGTSSILGWVGILLQRLYGIYPNARRPEDGPALVLIDEIDAHLHPRWQRKLVSLTREQFPNVQLLASSHSPLLAGAMRRNELRIVERDPDSGEMRASIPREDLSGQTADEILTSSLFALPTTRSPEAEKKIAEYFKLFEKHERNGSDEMRLRELEGEIDQLNYGPTRAMREVQKAVDESFEAQLDNLTDEMAASLSARLASESAEKEEPR